MNNFINLLTNFYACFSLAGLIIATTMVVTLYFLHNIRFTSLKLVVISIAILIILTLCTRYTNKQHLDNSNIKQTVKCTKGDLLCKN